MRSCRIVSVGLLLALMLFLFSFVTAWHDSKNTPVEAATKSPVSCQVLNLKQHPRVVCKLNGVVILDYAIDLPTVTVPVPTNVPIHIPGPTVYVTKHPKPTKAKTVYIKVPGDTKTVTAHPKPNVIVPSPSGQSTSASATMKPKPQVVTKVVHDTETENNTIVKRIFLGGVAIVVLSVLGILALFLGYVMGQKDAEKSEKRFLASVVDNLRRNKPLDK